MKNIQKLTILLLTLSFFGFAQQNKDFTKENFSSEEDYITAKDALLDGNDFYLDKDYTSALKNFITAYQYIQDNAKLNYKIGDCYLHTNKKNEALNYLLKAYQLDSNINNNILFKIGDAYHFLLKFEDAIKYYNKYYNKGNLSTEEMSLVNKRIDECKNGIKLRLHPSIGMISNIKEINSKYADYSPMLTADMQTMVFTSRREGTTGNQIDPYDMQYYEDIYITHKLDSSNWAEPEKIKGKINTKGHDANVGLTNDGQHLFIYRSNSESGDIFQSDLEGESWSKPYKLPEPINSKYMEKCISFTPDMRRAYFVSNRPGTKGGLDIFHVDIDKFGNYGEVINVGDSINTIYDEDGVFIHPDGKTMYFSSKGHNTMGGYDIFKSEMDSNGVWHSPVNVGMPINSADDDIFLVVSADGKTGYFSSIRTDCVGEKDIYKIDFSEKDPGIANGNLIVVTGSITDFILKEPIEAEIEIADNSTQEVIAKFKSNKNNGKFIISLPSGKNYAVRASKDGYLFHSENFNLTDSSNYQEVKLDVEMKRIEVNANEILRNIFFDYGKATLRDESKMELDELYKLLTAYPEIKLEISGHTDSISSKKFNIRLSERRAKSVAAYLINKGISKDRLTTKGYGFDKPIADNSTKEGRQKNRRVEFKIIAK